MASLQAMGGPNTTQTLLSFTHLDIRTFERVSRLLRTPIMPFHPLFQDSDADLTLRAMLSSSSDSNSASPDYDFRVHASILSRASPLLKQAMRQRSGDVRVPGTEHQLSWMNREGSLVFCFPEDPETTLHLLMAIYPMTIPRIDSLEELARLMAKARTYRLDRPFDIFAQQYRTITTVSSAFRSYAVARQHGLKREAAMAVRLTLSLPMTMQSSCILELRGASGSDIKDLLDCRAAGLLAARSRLQYYANEPRLQQIWNSNSNECQNRVGDFPQWFHSFLQSCLDRDPISIETAELRMLMSAHASNAEKPCSACQVFPLPLLQRAKDILQRIIDDASEVKLADNVERFLTLIKSL